MGALRTFIVMLALHRLCVLLEGAFFRFGVEVRLCCLRITRCVSVWSGISMSCMNRVKSEEE